VAKIRYVKQQRRSAWLLVSVSVLMATACGSPPAERMPLPSSGETYSAGPASRDGIGKFYQGREISHVMGHLGASWLERGSREREERTDLLLDFLVGLQPRTVADIGAGTGYFSLPLAARLPESRVLAVDIQPEMLRMLADRAKRQGLTNVDFIQGQVADPALPVNAVDLVFIVDAYHEFSHPREMMLGIVASLAPGGRVVLVEYRGEDRSVPIKPLHKMTEAQVIKEMQAVGLAWQTTESFLPQQHVLVFASGGG
jgi:SAM-dependent methyltransferase